MKIVVVILIVIIVGALVYTMFISDMFNPKKTEGGNGQPTPLDIANKTVILYQSPDGYKFWYIDMTNTAFNTVLKGRKEYNDYNTSAIIKVGARRRYGLNFCAKWNSCIDWEITKRIKALKDKLEQQGYKVIQKPNFASANASAMEINNSVK